MVFAVAAALFFRSDILISDFEQSDYNGWKSFGTAFGTYPAIGTLDSQMQVSGYKGKRLVNSYLGGDKSTGVLTSPEFKIERSYIGFLIGGGRNLNTLALRLKVNGRIVRQATGPNDRPGGSEALRSEGWDVREYAGKTAQIEIVDHATGGWGHINVDHIVQTDQKPAMTLKNVRRSLRIDQRYLMLPIKRNGPKQIVQFKFDSGLTTSNLVSLADDKADWWAAIDVSQYQGTKVSVEIAELSSDSKALSSIKLSKEIPQLYKETYRPQYHFSSKSGWLNDPNGLVYYNGEYHMFYQHDPVAGMSEFKLWGHAVSTDLVHWTELPDALYPDRLGSMWSGGGVVDWKNTSGLGTDSKPPMVLFYTAAGTPSTQCLAYSNDGRTFHKLKLNPLIKEISPYNRDPKVIWHEPTQKWVMTLYVEHDKKHFIDFFTSPDLLHWTYVSQNEGYFECPDFFELPVKGTNEKLWVLTAANSDYQVGTFDGTSFKPITPMLRGHYGDGYYAPQTFSDTPDGRRIQVGWMWTNPPEMPFTQSMSIPMAFELERWTNSYRLARKPIVELEKLETRTDLKPLGIVVGSINPFADFKAGESRLRMTLKPTDDAEWTMTLRGVELKFSGGTMEVAGKKMPLNGEVVEFDAFVDRVGLEIFVNGNFLPLAVTFDANNHSYSMSVKQGAVMTSGYLAKMSSIWK